jgi:hypothetical protein
LLNGFDVLFWYDHVRNMANDSERKMGERMSDFTMKCELQQQTPMIHFQHGEPGACLRGSDIKPRLDRFLLERLGNGADFKQAWLIGDGEPRALNYKLRVLADEASCERSPAIGRSFFGNMGVKDGAAKRQTVFYKSPIRLEIICFIPGLLRLLREHMEGFFLLHNFGTRASKGFGSFIVKSINDQPARADFKSIIEGYRKTPFYAIEYPRTGDHRAQLDDIAGFY